MHIIVNTITVILLFKIKNDFKFKHMDMNTQNFVLQVWGTLASERASARTRLRLPRHLQNWHIHIVNVCANSTNVYYTCSIFCQHINDRVSLDHAYAQLYISPIQLTVYLV